MKKPVRIAVVLCFLLIPATLYLGTKLSGRGYYLTATLVLLETMAPFFLAFESRKPQARELVLMAVLCALAVASRVVFVLPHFKPVFAIIMVSGMALGPEAGFLTGAMTAFASNFFYSQGPWTPWQMLSYGVCGFLFGVFFRRGKQVKRLLLAGAGFLTVVILAGPLLDSATLFTTAAHLSWKYAGMVFAAGFPSNVSNGIATALTLGLFGQPLLKKLCRMMNKYGLMEEKTI